MAKQTINIGTAPNASDGDPLRTAFAKINSNFDEVYTADQAMPALIRQLSAALLTSGIHVGITATYDAVNQRVNLAGFNGDYNSLINKPFTSTDSGAAASVYTPGDLAFDGGSSSAIFDPTLYNLNGGGA